MHNPNIALQLYSLRDEMAADFYGTLKAVREYGYTGVEFAGLYGHDPLQVRQMCLELGLEPISAHVGYQELENDMTGVIDCYHTLGCKHIVIPSLPRQLLPGGEGFEAFTGFLRRLGNALAEKGMVLQYHNHDFEFETLEGSYLLDLLYETLEPQVLQTQLDTCWVRVAGVDPVAYVEKYAGRIPTVHLKDYAGVKSANMYKLIGVDADEKQEAIQTFEFRALGKGVQDFPAIVAAARAGGAEWFIVELDLPPAGSTASECVAESARYLLQEVFN